METFGDFGQFVIHLAMVLFCVFLWRRSPGERQPDTVQRLLLVGVAFSFALYALCDGLALFGLTRWDDPVLGFEKLWQVRLFAANIGKTALMLYLVRQIWIKTSFCDAVKGRHRA